MKIGVKRISQVTTGCAMDSHHPFVPILLILSGLIQGGVKVGQFNCISEFYPRSFPWQRKLGIYLVYSSPVLLR